MRFFGLIILLSIFLVQFSSASRVDSLQKILETTHQDTLRVDALNALSKAYRNTTPQKASEHARQALDIAEKIDYKFGLGEAYKNLAAIVNNQGSYGEAMRYLKKGMYIMKSLNDKEGLASIYNNIGVIHYNYGNYPEALQYFQRSLKLARKLDQKQFTAHTLINIGNIYFHQKNNRQALKVYRRSLKAERSLGNQKQVALLLNNMGALFLRIDSLSKALEYHNESLQLKEQLNDRQGIAMSYDNIGSVYLEKQNYSKALSHFKEALELNHSLQNTKGVITSMTNIGEVYQVIGRYKMAVDRYSKALELSREIGSKESKKEVFKKLTEVYSLQGDYRRALEYHKEYAKVKDSIINTKKAGQIAQLETRYEAERKEKRIKLLEKEQKIKDLAIQKQEAEVDRQKLLRNASIGGLFLFVILAYVLYNRYSEKRKANKELQAKNNLIEAQRNKIVDSIYYAKRIQQSMLANESVLKKYLADAFIYYKPRDIVSGDFYWMTKQKNKLLIATVDCTGHGVPGAFMSMIGNMLLNEIVNQKKIIEPAEIVEQLHKGIMKALQQQTEGKDTTQDGMDVSICVIDEKNKVLKFVGAPNPIYLGEGKELKEIKGDYQGIGGMFLTSGNQSDLSFTTHEVSLNDGMNIYLFSDGYPDQFGGSNYEKFGYQRFQNILKQNQRTSMDKQKKVLKKEMEKWQGDKRQIDDMLVLGLKV